MSVRENSPDFGAPYNVVAVDFCESAQSHLHKKRVNKKPVCILQTVFYTFKAMTEVYFFACFEYFCR